MVCEVADQLRSSQCREVILAHQTHIRIGGIYFLAVRVDTGRGIVQDIARIALGALVSGDIWLHTVSESCGIDAEFGARVQEKS